MVQEEHEQAQGLWSVPLGRVEDNESMREAARRELSEETGYKARLQDEVFSKQMAGDKLNSLERFNSRDALLKVFSGSIVGVPLQSLWSHYQLRGRQKTEFEIKNYHFGEIGFGRLSVKHSDILIQYSYGK